MAQEELCLDGEEWRDIAGYEGLYQVSNLGRVRSLTRDVFNGKVFFKKSGKLMRITVSKNRYCRVTLTKDAVQTQWYVHRLVATAFLPNPDNLPEVDHIDANPSNNQLCNLRWVTKAENMRHVFELGHHYDGTANLLKPEVVAKARATRHKKQVVRSDGEIFESITSAARCLGVTPASVCNVLSGRRKSCRGFSFSYA